MANQIFSTIIGIASLIMFWVYTEHHAAMFRKGVANKEGKFIPKYKAKEIYDQLAILSIMLLIGIVIPEGIVLWVLLPVVVVMEVWRIYTNTYLEGMRYYLLHFIPPVLIWLGFMLAAAFVVGDKWNG